MFTARGEVFTLPRKDRAHRQGRGRLRVRYREARFMPDGKSIVALSTKAAKPSSGSIPPTAKASRSNGRTTRMCCAGTGLTSPDGQLAGSR